MPEREIPPEMIELAKSIHRALKEFNTRHPDQPAKIDSTLSRWLKLDPEWKPRRSDPEAQERPPSRPSVFKIREIAHRLETSVDALLGEQQEALSIADREELERISQWIEKKLGREGSKLGTSVTTSERPGEQPGSTDEEWPPNDPRRGSSK